MRLDQSSCDRKSETESTGGLSRVRLATPKSIEHVRQVVRRYPAPRVRHDEAQALAPRLMAARIEYLRCPYPPVQANGDTSLLGGELDRVRDQVRDDLAQSLFVPRRLARDRIESEFHSEPFLTRERAQAIGNRSHQRVQIDGALAKLDAPANDPRQIEHFVDECDLDLHVPRDHLDRALRLLVAQLTGTEQVRPAVNRVQWRAQLVREKRQELILRLIRSLRLFAPRGFARQLHRLLLSQPAKAKIEDGGSKHFLVTHSRRADE